MIENEYWSYNLEYHEIDAQEGKQDPLRAQNWVVDFAELEASKSPTRFEYAISLFEDSGN
jgi:hypothetical protein